MQALGCVHFLGLSCSGSGSWVLHKAQTQLGLCFVPFPGLRSSGDVVFGKCSRCDLSPPPSLPFSFLGIPSQVDVDHPEPQEVLISKEACLQFDQ